MRSSDGRQEVEVAVVGGGPAGLTAAIALASAGVDTALIAQRPARPDNRTAALVAGSVNALELLGVWEACRQHAAPLRAIRIVDGTRRLLRGPQVVFAADEIGAEAFGYNIENRHLVAALETRAAMLAHLTRLEGAAETVDPGDRDVAVTLTGGERVSATLVVGADGRGSRCRKAAGIAVDASSYDQAALTTNISHSRPHQDVSTEFHTETGPFTLVPLTGNRSGLVWVERPAVALHLAKREGAAITGVIEQRSHAILGRVTVEGPCGVFRLAVERARRLADRRIALVGEAAHVIPPIGAQGLNLGLRDAAAIAEIVVGARSEGADIGAPDVMRRYCLARRADVASRSMAVNMLNRSLLSELLPIHLSRGLGLYLLERVGPLRRAVMREGMAPALSQPRLMRGEPI